MSRLSKRTFVYSGKVEIFIYGEITYSGKLKRATDTAGIKSKANYKL